MPKISEEFSLCETLAYDCLIELLACESVEAEDEAIDDCLENILVVMCCGDSVPFQLGSVIKSTDWYNSFLPNLDENRFKMLIRVDFFQFHTILEEIKDDPVFKGKDASKQMSVELQLAIVLYRLGSSGEGASLCKIANLFGCRDGGSINIITRRVFKAILNTKDKYLFWPTETERKQIITDTFDELPHCIGYVGATEIELAEKPSCDPDSYYSRKQRFSLKAQVVCDYKLRIRHVLCGFPGSVHDARIFSYSSLAKKPNQFFTGMEWIAGDSAYTLTPSLITPFKRNGERSHTEDENKFNAYFSQYRVRIDYTIRILKEKFNSLKELKIRIVDVESIKFACAWFTTCCILHNILLHTEEAQVLVQVEENEEAEDPEERARIAQGTKKAGINKRNALLEILK